MLLESAPRVASTTDPGGGEPSVRTLDAASANLAKIGGPPRSVNFEPSHRFANLKERLHLVR